MLYSLIENTIYTRVGFFSVLADAHFPTSALCKNGPLELRADGKESTIQRTNKLIIYIDEEDVVKILFLIWGKIPSFSF